MKNKNIVAGIVLYNPNIKRLLKNIESVYPQVEKIIVFDNGSDNYEKVVKYLQKFSNIIKISSSVNKGIAHALNEIAIKAKEMRYDWLLTLDQDTVIYKNLINTYTKYAWC